MKKKINLTNEQKKVVDSVLRDEEGIYVVDACAGSGKTTTAVQIAKNYVKNKEGKVLFLVRNRDVKSKLDNECKNFNTDNRIEVYTMHKYALDNFKKVKNVRSIKVIDSDEINNCIHSIKSEDDSFRYISASSIKNMIENYYLNKDIKTIEDYCLFLLKDRRNIQRAAFDVRADYKTVDAFHYVITEMMKRRLYTFGMYLKEYALNYADEVTKYDVVIIDEAQDVNVYMSMLLNRIKYKKMYLVGDDNQQLYTWDNCISVLPNYKKVANEIFPLSISFRLNNETLKFSNGILKYRVDEDTIVKEVLAGNNVTELPEDYTKVTLFVTNAAMIKQAIKTLLVDDRIKISFKGFTNTTLKALLGVRLGYILHLLDLDGDTKTREILIKKYNIGYNLCKPNFIINELMEKAEKNDLDFYTYCRANSHYLEPELRQSIVLYKFMKYSSQGLLSCLDILDRNIKRKEEYCKSVEEYSTTHQAKGFEWDMVVLGEDLWDFDTINSYCTTYVAVTRAKILCDISNITDKMEFYDDVKKYLPWKPTLDGYDGNLSADLSKAKIKESLKEAISNYKDIPLEYAFIYYYALTKGIIRKGHVYNDDNTIDITDRVLEYAAETKDEEFDNRCMALGVSYCHSMREVTEEDYENEEEADLYKMLEKML